MQRPRFRIPGAPRLDSLLWLVLLLPFSSAMGQNAERDAGARDVYSRAAVVLDSFGETRFSSDSDTELENWLTSSLAPQLGLGSNDAIELAPASRSISNHTIRTLQQTHQGLDVVGLQSRLVLDDSGQVLSVLGKHNAYADTVSNVPALSLEQAQQSAGMISLRNEISAPVFLPMEDGELKLSWPMEGVRQVGGSPAVERVYVDAVTGEVLKRESMVYTAMQRKVMDMELLCRSMGINYIMDYDTLAEVTTVGEQEDQYFTFEGDPPSGVSYVDTVYTLLGDAYHFIDSVLGMDSIDDNGVTLEAFAGAHYHYDSGLPQCFGEEFNASWFGGGWDEMYIPVVALPFIEILFHELTHGIIDFGGGLVYENQSGALNEAIADAAGVSFRAWVQSGGRLGSSPSTINTFSDMWELRAPNEILRNMRNPAEGGYPDHFGDILRLDAGEYPDGYNDYGYVHSNSSIINQAFYVLVSGGQHQRLRIGPNVQGIGVEAAVRIYIEAAVNLLTPYASFEDARNGFALAAELLYGKGSPQWIAVHQSMDVVGIPGYWEIPLEPTDPVEPEPEPEPEVVPEPEVQDDPVPQPEPVPRPDPQAPPVIPDTSADAGATAYLYLIPVMLAIGLALLAAKRLRPQYADNPSGGVYHRSAVVQGQASHEAPVRPGRTDAARQSYGKLGELTALGDNIRVPLARHLLESREGMVIGRVASLSHIVLEDSHVSRRHARLRFTSDGLTVEDLNSSHGTSVDGQAIRPFDPKKITSGQLLRIAGISFKVELN